MRNALFIGGTGTISMSITKLLAEQGGWKLYVLNRGKRNANLPEGVESLVADINDVAEVKKAVGPLTFDVVADFIAFTPDQVKRDIDLFAGRTGQYIFISSASAYHKPVADLPITESTPLKNPFWQYSRDKIACEDLLVREFRDNDFPITIVRPSHTYNDFKLVTGVHGDNDAWQIICRIRDGKPVIIHGDGTSLWTVTHADDFAVGFAGLMGNPRAIGQAVHITSDDILTWNSIYKAIGRAVGKEPKLLHIASEAIVKHGPEFEGTLIGDKMHSVIFDNEKIRWLVPEYAPRIRFSDAVHTVVRNYLNTPAMQKADPEFDKWCDEMVKRYGRQ